MKKTLFLLLMLASFLMALFREKKDGLVDLASRSYEIDLRYFVDHEEASALLEESQTKEEPFYEVIDSTTIRKG